MCAPSLWWPSCPCKSPASSRPPTSQTPSWEWVRVLAQLAQSLVLACMPPRPAMQCVQHAVQLHASLCLICLPVANGTVTVAWTVACCQRALPLCASPLCAAGTVCWSPDSHFLATVNENMPQAVWVWDMRTAELAAVLLHNSTVRSMDWAPAADAASSSNSSGGPTLAVCTGSSRVYLWSPAGASIVHIPLQGLNAGSVRWGPGGGTFLLADREAFCCAYVAGSA
jgi:hypothetical protein